MSEPTTGTRRGLGKRIVRFLAAGYWLVLSLGLLMPPQLFGPLRVQRYVDGGDRAEHLVAFAILAALVTCAEWTERLVETALILVAYAVATELAQALIPWRVYDPVDIVVNLAGILSGIIFAGRYLGQCRPRPDGL